MVALFGEYGNKARVTHVSHFEAKNCPLEDNQDILLSKIHIPKNWKNVFLMHKWIN